MKKHLFLLLFAIVASIGTVSAQFISVADNSTADWNYLPSQYVFESKCPSGAAFTGLKSVKVYADPIYINILVEPNPEVITSLAWVPFHVYLNTDNSDATGGYSDLFTDANTDICLEGAVFGSETATTLAEAAISYAPAVYKWWGDVGGSGWIWIDPSGYPTADNCWGAIVCEGQLTDCNSQYVDGKLEIQINQRSIPAKWDLYEFGIGFDIDQNWSAVGILPCVTATADNPKGLAKKMQVKIHQLDLIDINGLSYCVNDELHTAMLAEVNSTARSVVIPASITYNNQAYRVAFIQSHAFDNCTNLKSVTMESTTPPALGGHAFDKVSNIYVPCGSLNTYKTTNGWTDYADKIKYVQVVMSEVKNGSISPQNLTICDENVQITAIPDRGYEFVRWNDNSTDNPRTVSGEQAGSLIAIFDYQRNGTCGKDNALAWNFDSQTKALEITGKGALSDNYTYGTFIESVTIGNEVTVIGQSAFYGCDKLKNVIIGSSIKVLEEYAFYGCSAIETITCYSMRPPTVNNNAFYNLPYSTTVYVPSDYLNTYKMHDAWGLYDVRPLGATSVQATDVTVAPAETTAAVVWPAVENAATYELVIRDKNGVVVCTLIFNASGQLTEIAFGAPARYDATQAAGFSFTVTGLEGGTSYDLTITAKDNTGAVLNTSSQAFTTTGGDTAIEDIESSAKFGGQKILRDGHLFILRDGKTYSVQGQEVK